MSGVFEKSEALREVVTQDETGWSVAEDLREAEQYDHIEFVFLRSSCQATEYWIEYNDDCGCTTPWPGHCARVYYKRR